MARQKKRKEIEVRKTPYFAQNNEDQINKLGSPGYFPLLVKTHTRRVLLLFDRSKTHTIIEDNAAAAAGLLAICIHVYLKMKRELNKNTLVESKICI